MYNNNNALSPNFTWEKSIFKIIKFINFSLFKQKIYL